MKKKFSLSKTLAIIVAISPLFMSLFCDLHYSLFIEILKGEGTTNPPPGYYELDENDSAFSVTVTPAQGWRIETLTVQSGESYGHLEQSQPSPLKLTDTEKLLYTVSGRPNDEDEQATEIKVAFEKIPDPSTTSPSTTTTTTVASNTTTTTTEAQKYYVMTVEANNDAYGNVTREENYPDVYASGSSVLISAGPKTGYKFLYWQCWGKDENGNYTDLISQDFKMDTSIKVDRDMKAVACFEPL